MTDLSFSHLNRSPWFHLLGSPILWSAQFLISYILVEFGCKSRLVEFEIISLSVLVLTFFALAGTLYVGWSAYRGWHSLRKSQEKNELEAWEVKSRRFLAFSGIFLSALFSLVILLTGLPALVLGPC